MPDNSATEAANKISDHGDRERFIRDLYAVAAFFTSNTDFPVPDGLTVHVRTDGDIELVEALALAMGTDEYGTRIGLVAQTDFQMANTVTGVDVIVTSNPRTLR